jgi:predicted membrane-bound spermidine synthase
VTDSIGKAYKPWLIASVAMLVGSLGLLAVAVTAAFVSFAQVSTPLWVMVVGGTSVVGVAVGFGGLFLLLATAGWRSFREGQRVQVISPERDPKG